MSNNSIKTILPIVNSEEKLDEINRLLDILSKRKRYSILVTMLLVFQKYKFQKLLKEFLVEGVQQIILANPFKVVSFSGVPFTIKNCFMGMRVIIGKHRIFQKELVDGYEYLNVNLIYTCIFLTDEIAKICKGSKNSKPVHSSLLDELDIMENNGNNNNNTSSGLNLGGLGSYNSNQSNNNSSGNNLLTEKRKRSKGESEEEENDDEEQEQEQEKDQEEEQEQENDSANSDYEEESKHPPKKHNNKKANANKSNKNTKNKNNKNNKTNKNNNSSNVNSSSKQMQSKASSNEVKNEKAHKGDNIISLDDSVEDEENRTKANNKNNNQKKGNNKNASKKDNKDNKDKESNPLSQLFANIFYPKDINYFKCSLQDFLLVWNFDKSSPVNLYLKDNYQNISKIKNVFGFMKNIGAKGQDFLEKLIKYIPELNNAANLTEEEKSKINENEDLKESKEILDKINSINLVFKEYDNKKKKLINIYQRIKSTVENIKIGATSEGKLFLKEDIEYLDMINKRFDQIMNEIIPLFNQLCEYYKDHMLKNISFNLQNVSRNLKENDLTLKAFSIFTQNLTQLFPHESGNINTVNDLILNESLGVEERDKIFRDIITREKDIILSNIEEYKKIYESEDNKGDVEESKENVEIDD